MLRVVPRVPSPCHCERLLGPAFINDLPPPVKDRPAPDHWVLRWAQAPEMALPGPACSLCGCQRPCVRLAGLNAIQMIPIICGTDEEGTDDHTVGPLPFPPSEVEGRSQDLENSLVFMKDCMHRAPKDRPSLKEVCHGIVFWGWGLGCRLWAPGVSWAPGVVTLDPPPPPAPPVKTSQIYANLEEQSSQE